MNKSNIFIILNTLFSGCIYYSMAGSIPAHIDSISIPIVENQTAEFGMSESVTENLLLKFCLLYTSPSPRDATLSRMPSSA